jgi:hypothetical protein
MGIPPMPSPLLSTRCRGVYGVGNTLRKLGQYGEALEKYELLAKRCRKPSTYSSFHNFHAHLPGALRWGFGGGKDWGSRKASWLADTARSVEGS